MLLLVTTHYSLSLHCLYNPDFGVGTASTSRRTISSRPKLARLALAVNIFAKPRVDDCSHAGFGLSGAPSHYVGDVRLQVNGDIEFRVRSIKLPSFAL